MSDLFKAFTELGLPWAAKFLAVLVLCGAFWRYVAKPIINISRKVTEVVDLAGRYLPVIEHIATHFRANHGSSLVDVIGRIEVRISAMEQRQRALLSNFNLGFFETDASGACTWVSRRYCELTGLLPHDAYGWGWLSAIHEEDRDKVREEWETCMEEGREFVLTYRFVNPNTGVCIRVDGRAIILRDVNGGVLGSVGSVTPRSENGTLHEV